jgi:recombination protein RecT
MSTAVQTAPTSPSSEIVRPVDYLLKYADSFTSALPTHVDPKQFIAVAMDAVRRDPKIEQAARNDMRRFTSAIRQAARRGLEPGTEQFYLVPFAPRRGAPQVIEGIVGYQGLVEMMFRAGAVQSVVAELVRANDRFAYVLGVDERPNHVVDWFGADRGKIVGVYAYATMEGGATSKVVVMGEAEINDVKQSSASARSDHSPWRTSPGAMWLKSAVRQLAKWVPTSAEYRREKLRAASDVWEERIRKNAALDAIDDDRPPTAGEHVDQVTGEIVNDVVDAEALDDYDYQPDDPDDPDVAA